MAIVVVIVNGRGLGIDTHHRHYTRWSASVIKVGMAYMNVCVSRRLKEELAWVIDKRIQAISKEMLFKTVVPLRN